MLFVHKLLCHLMQSVAVVALTYDEWCGSVAAGLSYTVDSDDFLHVHATGAESMDTAYVHNSGAQLPDLVDVECSESCRSSRSGRCRLQ